jgi:hypothetical protein
LRLNARGRRTSLLPRKREKPGVRAADLRIGKDELTSLHPKKRRSLAAKEAWPCIAYAFTFREE